MDTTSPPVRRLVPKSREQFCIRLLIVAWLIAMLAPLVTHPPKASAQQQEQEQEQEQKQGQQEPEQEPEQEPMTKRRGQRPNPQQAAKLSATPTPFTYRLRAGERVEHIAKRSGIPIERIDTPWSNGVPAAEVGELIGLPRGAPPPEAWERPTPWPMPTFVLDQAPADAPVAQTGPSDVQRVALTYDVGYDAEGTRVIAESLARRGVRATFFVVGEGVERNPEQLRHILENGHELANHSWSHPILTLMSQAEVHEEILKTDRLLRELAPDAPFRPYFRAPYGALDAEVSRTIRDAGYYIIGWCVDTLDWFPDVSGKEILETIDIWLRPGAIIIQHGSSAASQQSVDDVLDLLERRGFEPVTVSELLSPRLPEPDLEFSVERIAR